MGNSIFEEENFFSNSVPDSYSQNLTDDQFLVKFLTPDRQKYKISPGITIHIHK